VADGNFLGFSVGGGQRAPERYPESASGREREEFLPEPPARFPREFTLSGY
jgi:hypothetical protein